MGSASLPWKHRMNRLFLAPFFNWARKLKHPTLFKLVGALFIINVFVPDVIPFIDEILLGLATLLLANWKDRSQPAGDTAARDGKPPIDGSTTRG